MKTSKFLLYFIFFALFGCDKPDPEAYRQDPILKDYQSQLAATISEQEAIEKQLLEAEKEIKNSQPQSGQASIHRKRAYDMKNRIDQLKQQVEYWKIRVESRAKDAQVEYLKSRETKEPWPNPALIEGYHAQKRLRLSKMAWDNKDRIEKAKEDDKAVSPEQPK